MVTTYRLSWLHPHCSQLDSCNTQRPQTSGYRLRESRFPLMWRSGTCGYDHGTIIIYLFALQSWMHDFKWVSFVFSLSTKGYPSVGPAAGWAFLQRAEHFKWLWPRSIWKIWRIWSWWCLSYLSESISRSFNCPSPLHQVMTGTGIPPALQVNVTQLPTTAFRSSTSVIITGAPGTWRYYGNMVTMVTWLLW